MFWVLPLQSIPDLTLFEMNPGPIPTVTKDELIGMLTAENVELHKKVQELETQLDEEHKKRVHAEGLCEAWRVKWEWDCAPNHRLGAWD